MPKHQTASATAAQDAVHGLDILVERARAGERDALEQLVRQIQDPVYGLALRMLAVPAEAEDATQEILVKVITRLDSFRGESRFTTWVFAVAANHLRSVKMSAWERRRWSFDQTSEVCAETLRDAEPPTVEHQVLIREVRLLCLHGMLLCLDRDARLTFLLGEALELSGTEGAQVLGIQPAAFRKRLSRARARMQTFLMEHCGLVDPANRCRCELWCNCSVQAGAIDPDRPLFSSHPAASIDEDELEAHLDALDELARVGTLFKTLPSYRAPGRLLDELSATLDLAPSSSA